MASIGKLQTSKDGRRYWKIQVHAGHKQSPLATRFYWPTGRNGSPVSETVAVRQRDSFAAEFERQCKAGEVLTRARKKEIAAQEEAENAKLKTLKQYAEAVFMPTKTLSVTENTRSNYQQFLDSHIYPALGDRLLTEITPAMIKKVLLDYQQQGYAHASCVKLYNILNGIFDMAFLDDTIPISPMLKVKRPAQNKDVEVTPETEKALTAKEADYVLNCIDAEYQEALAHHNEGYDKGRKALYAAMLWKTYIVLSADTGARRGEMCGLKWSDIDMKAKTVTIVRNLQYTPKKGVYVATPKNKKKRMVDIGEDTVELLKAFQAEQSAHRLSTWVFSQVGTADPIHPQSPTRFFKKFGDRHNLPEFYPHLLRHTSASVSLTNGADVVSVAQRLGHSDTAVTLRMYAHANEESVRAAGQSARDAIKKAGAKANETEEKQATAGT